MNFIKSLILLLCITSNSSAQTSPFYKSYDWDTNPNYVIEASDKDIIALKEKVVTEFFFEDQNLTEYYLEHKVLWLNSDDRIEEYNKVYLPYASNASLVANKARVIKKTGEIIVLDASKILQAENEETGSKYNYFAFEGIEKGSIIEYYYVEKRRPKYQGDKVYIQDSYKKDKVEFDLFSPSNLLFKFKSFNDLPEVERDTLTTEKLHYKLHVAKIEKLESEYQAPYNASRAFLVYKIDKNTAGKGNDMVSYSNVSQNLYSTYYPDYSKKTKGLLSGFIKELELPENANEESIARKLDFFIKVNIYSQDVYSDDLKDLDQILTKKVANETGVIKLYIAVLRLLNVKHELVLTTDRKQMKFDTEFEATNFLTDFLLYFPKSKKYLSPNASGTRFGFPMPYMMDNYGLFIKEVVIGDFKSAVGKIKYIEPVKAEEIIDIMKVTIDFNTENLTENIVNFDRAFSGYYAMNIQPFMHLIQGEKRDELVDNFIENITKELEIQTRKIVNDDSELFGVKPLQFIVDFTTEAFVEKAGIPAAWRINWGSNTIISRKRKSSSFRRAISEAISQTRRVLNIPEGYKIGIELSIYRQFVCQK